MSKAKVLTGNERYAQLLDVGAKLAAKNGKGNVTRRMVAKAAKCSEGLVANYMGNTKDAQRLYAARAKKLGLTLPTKEQEEKIGAKLRAHGPRDKRDVRPRSAKEVKAIQKKAATKVTVKKSRAAAASVAKPAKKAATTAERTKSKPAKKSSTPAKPRVRKAPENKVLTPPETKRTAARAPKAPPTLPPIPAPLPPIPGPEFALNGNPSIN